MKIHSVTGHEQTPAYMGKQGTTILVKLSRKLSRKLLCLGARKAVDRGRSCQQSAAQRSLSSRHVQLPLVLPGSLVLLGCIMRLLWYCCGGAATYDAFYA